LLCSAVNVKVNEDGDLMIFVRWFVKLNISFSFFWVLLLTFILRTQQILDVYHFKFRFILIDIFALEKYSLPNKSYFKIDIDG